ncbi:MAG: hypothetical protein D6790_19855, partial [Caldilineae bacterium]
MEPLPPVLVRSEPADGAAWLGGPVTFAFDQPLEPASVAGLRVEPDLPGSAAVEGTRLIFTPDQPPTPGVRYHFSLGPAVRSLGGVALTGLLDVTLVSPAPLAVTGTQPTDGSRDVPVDAEILVSFNHPVVPLTGLDDQAGLPAPITIEPPVEGVGEWLNTGVFRFMPTQPLAGATTYQVTVQDLTALDGAVLAEPVTFTFTTAEPVAVSASPQGEKVAPDAP